MDEKLNFPLIIASGDSQMSPTWYSETLGIHKNSVQLCSNILSNDLGGYCINLGVGGSSNRRILRSVLHACIEQLQQNPNQKTIVVIGLSFDLRKEIWVERGTNSTGIDENFLSVQLAQNVNWWNVSRLQKKIDPADKIATNVTSLFSSTEKKYLEKWQHGEMFFYSPYAENTNLLMDLIMLTSFFRENNIDYLIFRGQPIEQFDSAYLMDFFKNQINRDSGILDLFNFSFNKWSLSHGYQPVDLLDRPEIGHPSLEAHFKFGKFLTQKLKEVYPAWA